MKKICVLFGAGADAIYDIKNGKHFALNVVGIKTKEMNNAICKYYSGKYDLNDYQFWCNKITQKELLSSDSEYQKIIESSLKKKKLSEYLENKPNNNKNIFDEQIKSEAENLTEKQKNDLLDKYISYMGIIDSKFHTLIYPKYLGPDNFWTVVKCYTRAYLTIVSDILKETDYLQYLENPKETLHKICDKTKKMDKIKESYYKIIKKYKDKQEIKIITTNYTPICEQISGISENNITYVHGKIGLFEAPYSLKVYNIEKDEKLPSNEICFPYLFIQSGTKPIVEYHQIKAYSKMIDFLNESERLIIVGYKINIDDNHINGLVKNLFESKEIIYLDYDNLGEDFIKKILRISKDNENFKCIPINSKNSIDIFEKCLND